MSYTENSCSNGNVNQYNKLVLALAAFMGVIGSAAAQTGGSIDTASLFQMVSAAFPQLTAWLIAYLMYQNPEAGRRLTVQHALPAYTPGEQV